MSPPYFVDSAGGRATFQQVRVVPQVMTAVRGSRSIRLWLNGSQTLCFQQSGDTGHAATFSPTRQFLSDATRSVTTLVLPENVSHQWQQFLIPDSSCRSTFPSPGIKPGPARLQNITHRRHSEPPSQHHLLDGRIDIGYPLRPKMLNAVER